MADADERFSKGLVYSGRAYIGFTSFYFCKYTDDGKACSGLNARLQKLYKKSIGTETNAQKKTEAQVTLFSTIIFLDRNFPEVNR